MRRPTVSATLVFLALVLLLPISPGITAGPTPVAPGNPAPQTTGRVTAGGNVYLPFVADGLTLSKPGSIQLINEAIADGTLDPETGLIYKMYATFSDPRLPAEYVGDGMGPEGDAVVREVMIQAEAGALSDETIRILAPFYVPPDHPGSWYAVQQALRAGEAGSQQTGAVTWSHLDAVGAKARILWPSDFANGPALAAGLKAALETDIWPDLTKLMGAEPVPDDSGKVRIFLWDSWTKNDGSIVPFASDEVGLAVPRPGSPIASTLYLRQDAPLGDAITPGMINTLAHEFMHAIQFAMGAKNWREYGWLMESQAVWAEDYVYPDIDDEWQYTRWYLDHAFRRLDIVDTYELHQYGSYMLPFFLTHTIDTTAKVIRDMWVNAATMDNSYLAIRDAVPETSRDYYWGAFMLSLWNKPPFDETYKRFDGLTESVKADTGVAPVQVSAASGPFDYRLSGSWPTGGARFYHFTFDSSVRSITILNGLSRNLTQQSIWDVDWGPVVEADQTYYSTELSEEDAAGVTMVGMMKLAGETSWRPVALSPEVLSYAHCVDLDGRIEELVIGLSNADWEHPDRQLLPKNRHTTLYATSMPCYRYEGTSKITESHDGVTWTFGASNVVYGDPYDTGVPLYMAWPTTSFYLMGADVSWSVTGKDSTGCTYSGSGSFHVNPHPGQESDAITLYDGILPGSPSYRGYYGMGTPDEETWLDYTVTCEDRSDSLQEYASVFLYIPLEEDRANVKVAADGTLSGSYEADDGWGYVTQYEWNLVPVKK